MGCASSKQPICRNCQKRCTRSAISRSYSMHVHHPPQRDGDSYHVVALTSSTLGSLKLDSFNHNQHHHHHRKGDIGRIKEDCDRKNDGDEKNREKRSKEFALGMIEAKTWSKLINKKIPKIIPKTPTRTPPGEPETINAWELMEGLEDTSPIRPHHLRSYSFHVGPHSLSSAYDFPISKPQEENGESSPKHAWYEPTDNKSNAHSNSNSESNATFVSSEFDPEVISTFRQTLEELPPANPFHLKPLHSEKEQALAGNITDAKKVNGDYKSTPKGNKDRVVLYFTSLRGVRKTYEDCCHVRAILKGTGVRVDERDVSMDSGFKEELKELLGHGFYGGGLPRVFIGKKYIGGAEELRKMHEDGNLEKLLECCEKVKDAGDGIAGICEACGDVRFVPCDTCSGSCKVYYEQEGDYDEDFDESDCAFQRCPDCNENGIIRCPICCD